MSPYILYYFDHLHLSEVEYDYWGEQKIYFDDAIIAGIFSRFIDFHLNHGTLNVSQKHSSFYLVDYKKLSDLPQVDQGIFLNWVKKVQKEQKAKGLSFPLSYTPKYMKLTTKVVIKYLYNNAYVGRETVTYTVPPSSGKKVFNGVLGGSLTFVAGSTVVNSFLISASTGNTVPTIVSGVVASVLAAFGGKKLHQAVKAVPTVHKDFTGAMVLTDKTKQELLYSAANQLEDMLNIPVNKNSGETLA